MIQYDLFYRTKSQRNLLENRVCVNLALEKLEVFLF